MNIEKESEKPVLHLMVNNTCTNHCPLCCNKQYDVDEIPVVTVEEMKNIDTICFTGGQPIGSYHAFFMLCCKIAENYKNIKKAYIYINGSEFSGLSEKDLHTFEKLPGTISMFFNKMEWGITMSPKVPLDWKCLNMFSERIYLFSSNRIYCFSDDDIEKAKEIFPKGNVEIVRREWQKDFKPAPNTIFRRLPIWI